MTTGSRDIAKVGMAVQDRSGARTTALASETGIVGALIVGERFSVGPAGIKTQAALETVTEFELQGILG